MKSSAIANGDTADKDQYNNLRQDAYASSMLLPHQQSSPDLTLYVEQGVVYIGGTLVAFAGGNSPSFTAPAANPRIDVLSLNSSGTLVRTAGSEAASPTVPSVPVGNIPICQVYNKVGQTQIVDTDTTGKGYIYKDTRPFIGALSNLPTLSEKSGVDISAGEPVFIDSNGEAIKVPTLKTLVNAFKLFKGGYTVGSSPLGLTQPRFCWLAPNVFVFVCVLQASTTYYLRAYIGRIDKDGQVSICSEKDIEAGSSSQTPTNNIIRLSDTKFVIAFQDSSASVDLVVGSVSDDYQITLGSQSNVTNDFGNNQFDLDALTSSTFIIAYRKSSNDDLAARVCSVSGTTITQESETIIEAGTFEDPQVTALTSTKCVVVAHDGTNLKARVIDITGGTTVVAGASAYTIDTITSRACPIIRLSDTHFVVGWHDGNSSFRVGSVSGDVITLGTQFNTTGLPTPNAVRNALALCRYGKNQFVAITQNSTSSPSFTTKMSIMTVSGTTITELGCVDIGMGISVTNPYGLMKTAIANVEGHILFVGSEDNAGYGSSIYAFRPETSEILVGLAMGSANNVVAFKESGISDAVMAGLTYGRNYFVDTDGSITDSGMVYIGRAISATKLRIDF